MTTLPQQQTPAPTSSILADVPFKEGEGEPCRYAPATALPAIDAIEEASDG